MINRLLRLPSPSFPRDMASGDAVIDQALKRLDAELVGSASVRRLTLIEVRDHLLQARERFLSEGLSEAEAARSAVEAFSDLDQCAAHQRSERAGMFLRSAPMFGGLFAGLMLVFSLLAGFDSDTEITQLLGMLVFQGVMFGVLMGAWHAYGFAPTMPTAADETTNGFHVYTDRQSLWAAGLLLIGMGALATLWALGLAGFGLMADLPVAANLFMLLLTVHLLAGLPSSLVRVEVDKQGMTVRGLFNRKRIEFEKLQRFQPLSGIRRLLLPGFGKGHRIEWRDANGVQQSMLIWLNGEMINADRLKAEIEQNTPANSPEPFDSPG